MFFYTWWYALLQCKKYAGPNILAENLQEAEIAAEANGLTLLGEFVEIVTESGLMHYIEPEDFNRKKVLHWLNFLSLLLLHTVLVTI